MSGENTLVFRGHFDLSNYRSERDFVEELTELLGEFLESRDEPAFNALLRAMRAAVKRRSDQLDDGDTESDHFCELRFVFDFSGLRDIDDEDAAREAIIDIIDATEEEDDDTLAELCDGMRRGLERRQDDGEDEEDLEDGEEIEEDDDVEDDDDDA